MRTFMLALVVAVAATSCRGPEPARDSAPAAAPAAQPANPQSPASPAASPGQAPANAPAPASSLQQPADLAQAPPSSSVAQAPAPVPRDAAPPTAGNAAAPPSAAHAEATPPAPRYREVTLPEGTEIALTLETAVASDTSRVEDPVRASVRRSVVVDDTRIVPAGTPVRGSVTDVARSGKVKGRARLSLRFNEIALDDERIDVQTTSVTREARPTTKKDAAKIGVPAAGGALVGAIIGGGKGAAIGATVGGGAGTAAVMTTRGEEVRLPVGSQVVVRLTAPVTVRIRVD